MTIRPESPGGERLSPQSEEDDARLTEYLYQRLRAAAGPVSEQAVRRQVADGIAAARVLAILSPAHILRFLRLRYLPASCWTRPGTQQLLVRVLTDTAVGAGERLAFVERLVAESGDQGAPAATRVM